MIKEVTQVIRPREMIHHGECLKVCQAVFGVSHADLARAFDVSNQAIVKWRKTAKFNRTRVEQLAEYFGMPESVFEAMAKNALSSALESDSDALIEYLEDAYPNQRNRINRISSLFKKISTMLTQIEEGHE